MASSTFPSFGRSGRALLAAGLTGALVVALSAPAQAAATAVPMGTAGSFAVLAGSGITNTGTTTINGDIGSFPTASITGTSTMTVNGTNHGGDAVTQQAKNDLVTAYNTAAGEGPANAVAGDLGGQTLTTGVYSGDSLGLTGVLTLDAQGSADAVWVFQANSTLTTATASEVRLINGASPCNVFWKIGSSATLGTSSTFRGTILALTSITLNTSSSVFGRVLARNGAVTLDTNTVSNCAAAAVASPSPSASPSASPSPSPSASPSLSPSASPSPSPSPSRTPTPTPTPTRTATPQPTASVTLQPTPSATTPAPTPTEATPQPSAAPAPSANARREGLGGNQVSVVPIGGVRTGDGSTAPDPGSSPVLLLLPLAALAACGATAWWRRTA